MNPDIFMPFALATMIGANLLRLTWELVSASRYELAAVQQQRQASQRSNSRQLRRRPLITVLLTTHNDQATILDCLSALAKSSYRKRQVIIIDHASTDSTKSLIKSYQDTHPKQVIRLLAKRADTNHYKAAAAAFKTYGEGEVILLLEANEYCSPGAITAAVQWFNQQADCQVVLPRRKLTPGRSVASLIQVYNSFIKNRSSKASTGYLQPMLVDRGAVFTREEQLNMKRLTEVSTIYAADSVVSVEPNDSFRQLAKQVWQTAAEVKQPLTGLKLIPYMHRSLTVFCVLTLPLLVTYCLYLAISLHQVALLLASGFLMTVLFTLAIWDDHQLTVRKKLMYIIGIPLTYSFFYVFSMLRAIALVRHGFNHS